MKISKKSLKWVSLPLAWNGEKRDDSLVLGVISLEEHHMLVPCIYSLSQGMDTLRWELHLNPWWMN